MFVGDLDVEATYRVHRPFSGYEAGQILTGREVSRFRNGATLVAARFLLRTPRPERKQRKAADDGMA
jgi:hypothetical protein